MRILIIVLGVMAMMSCNSQKRCSRFVRKNPDCFRSTTVTKTDTFFQELHSWDTMISLDIDTITVPSPCGDITVTRQPDGGTKIHQVPRIPVIRKETTKSVQLPCPCDCQLLDNRIKDLKKQVKASSRVRFQDVVLWSMVAFFFGLLIGKLWRSR